ncbi:MAG TPA: TlpA disulfide reductase family protein [Gemmatimonadales bacterium]|jgi:thiol-disulfide isomerase/thioredoxin|nr:TlpA disulfide reductase family protein [Gemmatimonadales bacterium]
MRACSRPVAIACAALTAAAAFVSSQAPGSVAPDFRLRTLSGDTASLASLKGRPVFLNFWASWCKPCRSEMADIISAYNAHKGQGLEVLAINLTDQERIRDVRQFVAELELPFPVLLDQKGKVRKSYALRGLPTSVFIDAQGLVRFVNPGPITSETMQRGLAQILPTQ